MSTLNLTKCRHIYCLNMQLISEKVKFLDHDPIYPTSIPLHKVICGFSQFCSHENHTQYLYDVYGHPTCNNSKRSYRAAKRFWESKEKC